MIYCDRPQRALHDGQAGQNQCVSVRDGFDRLSLHPQGSRSVALSLALCSFHIQKVSNLGSHTVQNTLECHPALSGIRSQ